MSTDVEVACHACAKFHHLGQRMGGGYSFGYGTKDGKGASDAMQFIMDHVEHGQLSIMLSHDTPSNFVEVEEEEE